MTTEIDTITFTTSIAVAPTETIICDFRFPAGHAAIDAITSYEAFLSYIEYLGLC